MTTPVAPTLDSFAQQLYDSIAPLAFAEQQVDYHLAQYCATIGTMFQVLDDYGRDELDTNGKDAPGWSQTVDILRCPDELLPWLAQFTGARFPPGLTADQQRAWIINAPQWRRGTVRSFHDMASIYLTGNKTLIMYERSNPAAPGVDAPWHLTIWTYSAETPNPTAVLNAFLSVKPAGIVLHYSALTGQQYSALRTNNATYAVVRSKYATYDILRQVPPS